MVLATHIVIGSAVASLFPNNPIVGFSLAFVSHFAMDAIPHWDYKLKSKVDLGENPGDPLDSDLEISPQFVRDLFCIGLDILIGVALAIFILGGAGKFSVSVLIAGALGGAMPDFLQFAYMKIRRDPLTSLQQFHHFVHAKKRILNPIVGIISQLAIITLIFVIL